jgi:uncharacterized protein involved in exopolysaccharide biosynthesis
LRPESLDDYAGILRRRLFVILSATLIITGGVVAVGLRLPRAYTATVLMDVEPSREAGASLIPNLAQIALGGGGGSDPVLMQTIVSRLSTRAMMNRVYREFMSAEPEGARRLPPVSHLGRSIRAGVEPGSRLITLTVELSEAEGGARNAALLANQVVTTLRKKLSEENVDDKRQETGLQRQLLHEKRLGVEARLAEMRENILTFADEHGNPTLWSAELQELLSRQASLRQERRGAFARRTAADAALAASEASLLSEPNRVLTSTTQSRNPTLTTLEQEQIRIQTEAARNSVSGLAPTQPERAGIAEAAKYLQGRIDTTTTTAESATYGPNARRAALLTRKLDSDIALASIKLEIDELDALLAEVGEALVERAGAIPTSQLSLESLQRQAEALTKVYEELLVRESQMELALAFAEQRDDSNEITARRVGGIALVDPALPQFRPIRPRPMLLAASGAVLGVLLAIALAVTLEWRERRFSGDKEMPHGGLGDTA